MCYKHCKGFQTVFKYIICQVLLHYLFDLAALVSCDTEVAAIDLAKESPVHHGQLTCFSLYAGNSVDFGDGKLVWVDTLDGENGVLDAFRPFFEE